MFPHPDHRPSDPFFPRRFEYPASHPLHRLFKSPDGRWDMSKISSSLDEVNKFINQLDPLIRQLQSLLKR